MIQTIAEVTYKYPIENVSGRLNKKEKSGSIQRQKHYRNSQGKIIGEGTKEAYIVRYPRDYKEKPMTSGEQFNTSTFQQAILMAKQERENPEQLAYWTERWEKQLEKGDPEAKVNPKMRKRTIYRRLDMFIQTMIQQELRKKYFFCGYICIYPFFFVTLRRH